MDADQAQQQPTQGETSLGHSATAAAASSPSSSSSSSSAAAQGQQEQVGGPDSVATILDQLQRLTLQLREEHGLACAILGKDGRVVAFDSKKEEEEEEEEDAKEEEEESVAAAIHPKQSSSDSSSATFPSVMEHFVGHEHADVILKIDNDGRIMHLYASSGKRQPWLHLQWVSDRLRSLSDRSIHLTVAHNHTYTEALSRHSPYFEALFAHPFTEARSRIVELNLPCVDALDATLFQLYTGQAPELLPHGARKGISADLFFGLLANAKFLLMDKLKEQCTDFLARQIKAGRHERTYYMMQQRTCLNGVDCSKD
jgi:hypothetical protein